MGSSVRVAMAIVAGAIASSGCSGTRDQPQADTAAVGQTPAPASISLAELKGTWQLRSLSETGDSTIATYQLIATEDPADWRFVIANRDTIPVRVTAAGDSIMTEAGPFESALRTGVPVTLRGVLRVEAGRLVGTTVAHFTGGGPDSVLRVKTEGTRAP